MPRNNNMRLNQQTIEVLNQWRQWHDQEDVVNARTTPTAGKFRFARSTTGYNYSTQNVQEQITEIQGVLVDFADALGIF